MPGSICYNWAQKRQHMENIDLNDLAEHDPAWKALKAVLAVCLVAVLAVSSASILGPTTIKVTVNDYVGAALSGARVLSIGQPEEQMVLDGTTSQEGNMLVFSPVKPGEYQIQVSCAGYGSQVTQVTVQRGMIGNITFKLTVP